MHTHPRGVKARRRFNGHPPLGVNATDEIKELVEGLGEKFQWAPTLGGECYSLPAKIQKANQHFWFQWAPTLGGECYKVRQLLQAAEVAEFVSMGTHPWG